MANEIALSCGTNGGRAAKSGSARSILVLALLMLGLTNCGTGSDTVAPETVAPAAAAVAAVSAGGEMQVAPKSSPQGDIVFESAWDLQQNPPPLEPMLRGGMVARSAEWPASFYATFSTPRGTAACTSALIGPQVLLTAAHCVPANGAIGFKFGAQTYAATCAIHDRYASDDSADFALCEVTPAFAQPVGFSFETIDTTPMAGLVNQPIVLTGFGCISDAVANAATDGKYRIGTNVVEETSQSPAPTRGAPYYAPTEVNNLLTRDGGANLCPGDSGGPAFRRSSAAGDTQYTNRRIIGVNSRVFYRDAARTTYGSSLVSATGGPDFRDWAEQWTATRNLSACGLRGAIPNCRN